MKYYIKRATSSVDIKLTNDQKYLAFIGRKVWLYNFETREQIKTISGLTYPICANFSPSGKFLAVKNTAGKAGIYDVETGDVLCMNSLTKTEGWHIYFTPDEKYVVSADWGGKISLLDWRKNKNEVILSLQDAFPELQLYHLKYDECLNGDTFIFQNARWGCMDYLTWKYPFHENEYCTQVISTNCDKDTYCPANGLHLCQQELAPRNIRVSNEENQILYETNASEEQWLTRYFSWSSNGRYWAYILNKKVKEVNGYYAARVIRTEDGELVREYALNYGTYIGFSPHGDYLLIGESNKSYCIAMEDVLSGN